MLSTDTEVAQGKKLLKKYTKDASLIGKVTDIAENEIESDEFVKWNREVDMANEEFKEKMGVLEKKVAEVKKRDRTKPRTKTRIRTTSNPNSGSNSDSTSSCYALN